MSQPSPVPDRPAPQSSAPPSESGASPESSPTPPGDRPPAPGTAVTPHEQAELHAPSQAPTPPGDLHVSAGGEPDNSMSAPRSLGTAVPFAAPPRDRDGTRLAITIVVSVLAVVLLCGGGLVGMGMATVAAGEALLERSENAADEFMGNIVDRNFPAAYDSLCQSAKDELTPRDFESHWFPLDIARYELGPTSDTLEGDMSVPVDARTAGGEQLTIRLTVALSGQNMEMSVCGWEAD